MKLIQSTTLGLLLSLGLFLPADAATGEDLSLRTRSSHVHRSTPTAPALIHDFLEQLKGNPTLTPARKAEALRTFLEGQNLHSPFSKTAVQKAFMAWKTDADITTHSTEILQAAGLRVNADLMVDSLAATLSALNVSTPATPTAPVVASNTSSRLPTTLPPTTQEEGTTASSTVAVLQQPQALKTIWGDETGVYHEFYQALCKGGYQEVIKDPRERAVTLQRVLVENGHLEPTDPFDLTAVANDAFVKSEPSMLKGMLPSIMKTAGYEIQIPVYPTEMDIQMIYNDMRHNTASSLSIILAPQTSAKEKTTILRKYLEEKGYMSPRAPFNSTLVEGGFEAYSHNLTLEQFTEIIDALKPYNLRQS